MTMTFLARFKIKADRDADFVALIEAAEKIAADEPGTLAYKFYRLEEPHGFAVYESFADEEAEQAHQKNPQTAPLIEKMLECMDGTYTREYLYPV